MGEHSAIECGSFPMGEPDRRPLIPLDTYLYPWGRVAMIHLSGGERMYMCEDPDGCVSRIDEETAWAAFERTEAPR